jgi:hypothetical protein
VAEEPDPHVDQRRVTLDALVKAVTIMALMSTAMYLQVMAKHSSIVVHQYTSALTKKNKG